MIHTKNYIQWQGSKNSCHFGIFSDFLQQLSVSP